MNKDYLSVSELHNITWLKLLRVSLILLNNRQFFLSEMTVYSFKAFHLPILPDFLSGDIRWNSPRSHYLSTWKKTNRMQSHPSNQGAEIIYLSSQAQRRSNLRCFQESSLEIQEIVFFLLLLTFSISSPSQKTKHLRKFHLHLRKYF